MEISVIIPTLNEEESLPGCIEAIRRSDPQAEIIVVDGGSSDRTAAIARELGTEVVTSMKGRGTQMNRGASVAVGEIFLFLHADTVLQPDSLRRLRAAFGDPLVDVTAFRSRFVQASPLLRVYSFFSRFETRFTTFGDQAIAVRSEFFGSAGGFPYWPLFEDVEFLRRARKRGVVRKLPAWVATSARKFLARGILRQQVANGLAIYRFHRGESPEVLWREYYGYRRAEEEDGQTVGTGIVQLETSNAG